jgi:hypothetical protein
MEVGSRTSWPVRRKRGQVLQYSNSEGLYHVTSRGDLRAILQDVTSFVRSLTGSDTGPFQLAEFAFGFGREHIDG